LGDPTRSSPAPGERAEVRFFVAAPSGQPQVSYALSLCAARATNAGFPNCDGAPLASAREAEPSNAAPELSFEVPTAVDLDLTPHAFVQGLICADASSSVSPDGVASCSVGAGTELAFEFEWGGKDPQNHSPTLTEEALRLDGAPWAFTEAGPDAGCSGQLPEVRASSSHRLGVSLEAADFEPLQPMNPQDPARETLLVSQFSDTGTLDHAFLSLSADAQSGEVNWTAPPLTGQSAAVARFYFVVRDARGGEDFATRALCVVP